MQTFLPYPDFAKSAKVLDRARLGKQRVECLQLLAGLLGFKRDKITGEYRKILKGEKVGWVNHPASKMWKGYERALARYGWVICQEWIKRGYKDTCKAKIFNLIGNYKGHSFEIPSWLGDEVFHRSHQSNLLRKNPEYYGKFFNVKNDLPYIWPSP